MPGPQVQGLVLESRVRPDQPQRQQRLAEENKRQPRGLPQVSSFSRNALRGRLGRLLGDVFRQYRRLRRRIRPSDGGERAETGVLLSGVLLRGVLLRGVLLSGGHHRAAGRSQHWYRASSWNSVLGHTSRDAMTARMPRIDSTAECAAVAAAGLTMTGPEQVQPRAW